MEQNKKKEFAKHLLFILTILSVCFYLFLQIPVLKDFVLIRCIVNLITHSGRYFTAHFYDDLRILISLLSFSSSIGLITSVIISVINTVLQSFVILIKNIFLLIPLALYIAYTIIAFKNKRSKILSIIISLLMFMLVLGLNSIPFIIVAFENGLYSLYGLFLKTQLLSRIISIFFCVFNTTLKIILLLPLFLCLITNTIIFIKESDLKLALKIVLGILSVISIVMCSFGVTMLNLDIVLYNFEVPESAFLSITINQILSILYYVGYVFYSIQTLIPFGIITSLTLIALFIICIVKSITLILKKSKALKILGIVSLVLTLLAIIGFIIIQLSSSVLSAILWLVVYIIKKTMYGRMLY